jgi:hypothetical protein
MTELTPPQSFDHSTCLRRTELLVHASTNRLDIGADRTSQRVCGTCPIQPMPLQIPLPASEPIGVVHNIL